MDAEYQAKPVIDWQEFETILLDMDGTVLDLAFDNYFWRQLVPKVYADQQGITHAEASEFIYSLYESHQGTLNWYCVDFWSENLGLDLPAMKFANRERITMLPGAAAFLDAVVSQNKRLVLVTNAHPVALDIKRTQTGLHHWFKEFVSSHQFGLPKEHEDFWHALEEQLGFAKHSTLFVDDSLPVLDAARAHGLGGVVAVRSPGTGIPVRDLADHDSIDSVKSWVD
jgi:putative hydrolase of the HAD superfamily